uniref:Protein adenylyltransferase Fic n=3 Tax=Cacopsylla melanoneura TaxID=428564 RepID=A0A8D9EEC9_9HEMI
MRSVPVVVVFVLGVLCSLGVHYLLCYLQGLSSHHDMVLHKTFSPIPYDGSDKYNNIPAPIILAEKHDLQHSSSNIEALGTISAAIEMKKTGKLDKALKLFEHAFAIAPQNADVLNAYGEFIEETQSDIISADKMYFKALISYPDHGQALVNRQRTALVVEELDRDFLRKIDDKRDKVSRIPESDPALCKAKKESYFQHIYHTVGIEGNSMSLAQTRSIVETRMAVGGKSIAEHNEILGLDLALKYINNTLINRVGDITVHDILEIHKRVLGFADPLASGMFRRTQVFVGGHIPPTPSHIIPLMDEFIAWLNSDSALRMHPVRFAAIAHYKLVHIHPFIDGNGRTSRLLMNLILMQAGYPPVIIPKHERHTYYQVLEEANRGDIRPFVRFIAQCTDKTLNLFLWSTSEYSATLPQLGQDEINMISPQMHV